jgi:hypothetical protein
VGVVAIAANHSRLMHFALYKRAVDVNLIANLAIRPIEGLLNERKSVGVEQVGAVVVVP